MSIQFAKICIGLAGAVLALTTSAAENPFIGEWALTVPGGYPGWLGIKESGSQLEGSMLWRGGSVEPVNVRYVEGTLTARAGAQDHTQIARRQNDQNQRD